jgi:ABC-2 type transport system ATP-binding protein
MIQVENLTKYFGPVMAVDGINFEVGRGEIVGFLGPNGAGKTTTMRILTTFLPATSGVARVAGHDVMNESLEVRKNIGYLPESVPLYPEMRIEEYLTYRAKLKGVDRRERQKRIDDCLQRCRIKEVRRRLLGTLSKGYRQRVGLADALIHDPQILILDEPTSGLDPVQIEETLNAIRALRERHTILLSTHILPEVEEICDRVIIIRSGRIGLDRPLAEIEKEKATVVVEVRGPADAVTSALQGVAGVATVTRHSLDGDLASYEVVTDHDQDPREAIFERVAKGGWTIRRLDLRRRRLQDLFKEVMMDEHQWSRPTKLAAGSTAITERPAAAG